MATRTPDHQTRHCTTAQPIASALPVLSIRASVPEPAVAAFVAEALDSIRLYTREHGITVAGPPFAAIHPSRETGVVDAEAGWPTTGHARGSGRIHAGAIARP
jgi:hypothetical protein